MENFNVFIDDKFPKDKSTEDLEKFISDLSVVYYKSLDKIALQKYSYVLQIGLSELQNRKNQKSEETSKRYALIGIGLTTVAILLSTCSIYYSDKDDKADTVWMKEQIEQYQEMNKNLIKINSNLEKSIINNTTKGKSDKSESI